MQVQWLLDMKGIPNHCNKSLENFLTFHYVIFSTVVFQHSFRQKQHVKRKA